MFLSSSHGCIVTFPALSQCGSRKCTSYKNFTRDKKKSFDLLNAQFQGCPLVQAQPRLLVRAVEFCRLAGATMLAGNLGERNSALGCPGSE